MTTKTTRKPQVEETTVQKKKATSVRLNKANARNAFWYRDHTGELEMVTSESSNDALGITSIIVYDPSDKQLANGTIASIKLETVIGSIRSINIKESTNTPGAIYLQTGSRNIGTEDAPKWFNEVTLSREVQAQILSYVDTMLEEV